MERVVKADTLAQIAAHDAAQPVRFPAVLGIWLLVIMILLVISTPSIMAMRFPDPDDLLRLLQVRDWLAGQDWYDVRQYRMNAPEGAPMHWSRLVDIPLAIVITILTPLLGSSLAEIGALIIVPVITLLCVMCLIAKLTHVVGEGASGREAAYLACFLLVMVVPVVHQLRPMRIDHHGWQIVLGLTALSGMITINAEHAKRGAVICGGALALWLSISMEGLPMAAAFMAMYALLWLCNNDNRQLLVLAMASLTSVSALSFLLTRALSHDAWIQYCDAISPVHIGVFALGTALLALLARLNPLSRPALIAGFGFTGSAALALLYGGAPQCTNGAFADLDPLVRTIWHSRVNEGLPLWQQTLGKIVQDLVVPMIALCALMIHWLRYNRRSSKTSLLTLMDFVQTPKGRIAVLLCCALAVSVMIERAAAISAVFALPIAANMLVHMLNKVRSLGSPLARIAGTLGVFALVVPGLVVAPASALISTRSQNLQQRHESLRDAEKCLQFDHMQLIQELPDGNVMAPLDMGPAVLFASNHKIVASGHHRNDDAMHDVLSFWTGNSSNGWAIAQSRNIDYVIYCQNVSETLVYSGYAPQGLMAKMRKGETPLWLEPVTLYGAEGLKVWRVKR